MPRHAAALTLALLLLGCSDPIQIVSPSQIESFQVGKTNQTEIAAALGKPSHTILEADGTKIDQYPYAGGASSSGFLPEFVGGSAHPDRYGMVSFSYSGNGTLKALDKYNAQ